jgi:hypothetical protein
MADHQDAQAQGQAPSYLELKKSGSYWLWWIPASSAHPTLVLGVYTEPPPAEMVGVRAELVGDGTAARAAAWITVRLNEAERVAQLIPDWPNPPHAP